MLYLQLPVLLQLQLSMLLQLQSSIKQHFAVINCAAMVNIDAVAFVNAVVVLMQ